jgi:hypothetical protein
MEPTMVRKWRFVPWVLVGALAAGAALSLHGRSLEKAPVVAARAPEVEDEAPPAAAALARPITKTRQAEAPAPASEDPLELKRRNAAEGVRARIAAREQKLAELDWDAPRPGPPPADEPAVGKREAALTVASKLEQTEQMTGLLRKRIAHVEERLRSMPPGATSRNDALVRTRLETRVAELDRMAQSLRERPDQDALALGDDASAKAEPDHVHMPEAGVR